MEDAIPTQPATVIAVSELIRKMECDDSRVDEGWSYRVNGFLSDDPSDTTGFGSLLSASKRISAASAVVKVDTRKVVPWPADVREGDMVQVLANIASARLHAISVVRVHDMDTEFDLKLLQSSYRDVVAFMERPRPKAVPLTESIIANVSSANMSSTPLIPIETSCQTSHMPPKERGDRPSLSKVQMDSLFDDDDDDDDDTFDLISGLNGLSSAADSTNSAVADQGESALLNRTSGRDSASRGSSSGVSSRRCDRTRVSGEKNLASSSCVGGPASDVVDVDGATVNRQSRRDVDNVFVAPRRPAFASKNSGRYSGGGTSRRKKSSSDGNGRV